MRIFDVVVEKQYNVSGLIHIQADSAEEAVASVKARIDSCELNTSDPAIEWNDDQDYIDNSFQTTGDVN
jgi:hypothetical protein